MTTKNTEKVLEVFAAAAECPADGRRALLDELCGSDAELRTEVESLLAHDTEAPEDFMQPQGTGMDSRSGTYEKGFSYEQPLPHGRGPVWDNPDRDGSDRGGSECEDDEPDPRVGQHIGRYLIKSVIASGGMGTVYLAEQDQPRRDVALKIIRPEFASRSGIRRFEIEAEFLAQLRHSNIAHVYEAGVHQEQGPAGLVRVPYFAMEYVEGGQSITAYARDKSLTREDRLRLFVQVCDAVHHGHLRGVIHRDLKPANILVDGAGQVKVIDFGVARATDGEIAVTTVGSGISAMIGTPQYMSPEQCRGEAADVDVRSDVYSLGVVLYELMCDRRPYDFGTVLQAVRVICETEPTAPRSVDRTLRGDVEAILLTALVKNPDKRYQSAGDMAADIRRFLRGEPISVRPPTRWARTVRWAGRHPVMTTAGLASLVGLAIIAGTVGTVWLLQKRPHTLVPTLVESHKRTTSEIRLVSLGGSLLKSWTATDPEMVIVVHKGQLIDRPDELGGGRLAVMGFNKHEDPRLSRGLAAFDVDRDLNKPAWTRRIEPGDPVPQPQTPEVNRFNEPEDFACSYGGLFDIFAESPGPEVVVVFLHGNFSQCILRIYDLRGELLYEVWHDGNIERAHWMADEGLLVLGALNGVRTKKELGLCEGESDHDRCIDLHPSVVFAIRPRLGRILHDKYIGDSPGPEDWDPKWYLTTDPDNAGLMVTPPSKGDERRSVGVSVFVKTSVDGCFSLNLAADGREIGGPRQLANDYLANQDKLPDVNTFKLVPFSEVLERAKKLSKQPAALDEP